MTSTALLAVEERRLTAGTAARLRPAHVEVVA